MIRLAQWFLILFALIPAFLVAQTATLSGKVYDEEDQLLSDVSLVVQDQNYKTIAYGESVNGTYELELPANTALTLVVQSSYIEPYKKTITLSTGQRLNLDLRLKIKSYKEAVIKDRKLDGGGLTTIDAKHTEYISTTSDAIATLVKTLPGVTTNNELSSQYNVRGGSFDENLVYVNDFEIYRPFLVRSGQQEGLSFINSDMVDHLKFSAGGFDAKYGDKLSSVLDIKYKKPKQLEGKFSAGLLGASATVEGVALKRRLGLIASIRNRSIGYVLKSLDTKGEYRPSSSDAQLFANFILTDAWSIEGIANYNRTTYILEPESRETDFGFVNEGYKAKMYFDGKEKNQFKTAMGGLSLNYQTENTQLKFLGSYFNIEEQESSDVNAEYFIRAIESDLSKETYGQEKGPKLGVGGYFHFIRNNLQTELFNISHKGSQVLGKHVLLWGGKYQQEFIRETLNEWQTLDSAGYILPYPVINDTEVSIQNRIKGENVIHSSRIELYIQDNVSFNLDSHQLELSGGLRLTHWSLMDKPVLSPRFNLVFTPHSKLPISFRIAAGRYIQLPFYRELKELDGSLNTNRNPQRSTHYIFGTDFVLNPKNKLRLMAETYYKDFQDLIPYTVDNVRIRYYGGNISKGYSYGIDTRLVGEFVEDAESWLNIGVMATRENIDGDSYKDIDGTVKSLGYIPRPNDQTFHASLFYQDYMPFDKTWKVNLTLMVATGLPKRLPNDTYSPLLTRMPFYRRVDVGFSKQLIKEDGKKPKWLKGVKSAWIGVDIFNILGITNTISYTWIKDYSNKYNSVPNYLTQRLINAKLIVHF